MLTDAEMATVDAVNWPAKMAENEWERRVRGAKQFADIIEGPHRTIDHMQDLLAS